MARYYFISKENEQNTFETVDVQNTTYFIGGLLRKLAAVDNLANFPWLVDGDFNEIMKKRKKKKRRKQT